MQPDNQKRESYPPSHSHLLWLCFAALACASPEAIAQPVWSGLADIARDTPPPLTGNVNEKSDHFVLGGVGYSAFPDTPGAVGDNLTFRYELVTGDFDKRVRLVSLYSDPTVDRLARAGLMVRASANANSLAFEIAAANPAPDDGTSAGANHVRVAGRARIDQIYSRALSRDYPGVRDALPNQWLRMRRVGDAWAFFVGTNGVDWSLISEQYQIFPPEVLIGVFATPDNAAGHSMAMATFADYGDFRPTDREPPRLVSVGTLDKKTIGLKFSEPVTSATATVMTNYRMSEGTIVEARMGIGGDTVYLTVSGLSKDTFSVTVVGGVLDTSGNPIAANSSAVGKASNWTSTDIGYIQEPLARPTPGDDPYRIGQAVAISSDPNPEIEIVGGGSNVWNLGDYVHYLYREYTGDFDVAVAVERFDKRGFAGGNGNGGIHVRSALYRSDTTAIGDITEVPCYANVTYYEGSVPDLAAIQLHRNAPGSNYRLSGSVKNETEISGLLGFHHGLRAVNASGDIAPASSPSQAKWLRVTRVRQAFTSYLSYNGVDWLELPNSAVTMTNLPQKVLVGFAHHNDTGYGIPPEANLYAGNGTSFQNESNYGVLRIHSLGDYQPPKLRPKLRVTVNGTHCRLNWSGRGYFLFSATQPDGPFHPAAGVAISIDGDLHTVTLNPGSACAFYRLAE